MTKKLNDLRKKIDAIDERLLKLLNQRALHSQKIGEFKRSENKSIYAPDREFSVLKRLCSLNKGPITSASIEAIYREIMSSSLSLEKEIHIAYLGPEYTFTHQASVKKFGQSVNYVACDTITDVFNSVENGKCDYGVVPVENSIEGAIYHTLDSFIDSNLKVCSEILLKINLNLLSKERDLGKIKRIYSNPQVFGQCRRWLDANAPKAELVPLSSTAKSAEKASKEKYAACIASRLAADKNHLHMLAPSIQDSGNNTTRFMVLSQESAKPTKHDMTSIILLLKDRPGALQKVLEPFQKNRINLTKIESRPSKKRHWEYYFFIDLDAHMDELKVKKALKIVSSESVHLKVLGSYPKSRK